MQKPDRRTYLTQTPIPRLIWSLAVPTIISMLVTGIYNSADTYFVGRISTQATAAVGLVFSVMAIIQALGFFCGHGWPPRVLPSRCCSAPLSPSSAISLPSRLRTSSALRIPPGRTPSPICASSCSARPS